MIISTSVEELDGSIMRGGREVVKDFSDYDFSIILSEIENIYDILLPLDELTSNVRVSGSGYLDEYINNIVGSVEPVDLFIIRYCFMHYIMSNYLEIEITGGEGENGTFSIVKYSITLYDDSVTMLYFIRLMRGDLRCCRGEFYHNLIEYAYDNKVPYDELVARVEELNGRRYKRTKSARKV